MMSAARGRNQMAEPFRFLTRRRKEPTIPTSRVKGTFLTQSREDAKAGNDLELKRSSAYLRDSASLR